MSTNPNALSWFEIPVSSFDRAKAFYEAVMGRPIQRMDMGPFTMGFLASDPAGVGGAIVLGEGYTPAQQGTIIYLPGGEDLTAMLVRVGPAGGTIVVPKTEIGGDFGFYAHFIDTEGNKVGLHSMG